MEHSLVVEPESHGVPDKVLRAGLESEFGVHVFHRALVDVQPCLDISLGPERHEELRTDGASTETVRDTP